MTKKLQSAENLDSSRLLDSEAEEEDSNKLLQQAMAGVIPLRSHPTAPRQNGIHKAKRVRKNGEERQLLEAFVAGKTEFDWSLHPAYHQGGAASSNRRLTKKLRSGAFSVQAELDLHGLTRAEAQHRLERFLYTCRMRGFRCIRIIHGKGKNSANHEPILKKQLVHWLSIKRISQYVIAFTSASPTDGGTGATYVLLRTKPQRRKRKD